MKPLVLITGRIGKDAETRPVDENRMVYVFSVATSHVYNNDDGKQTSTTWHDVRIFANKVSEKFLARLANGAQIVAQGTLEYNEWEKDGIKRKDAYIEVKMGDIDVPKSTKNEE